MEKSTDEIPEVEKRVQSPKEKKIRKITQLYYSRPDVQKAMFEFSRHREISPRYYEGFGKRPDAFQFKGDILSLAKKGATSFHSSEELWTDPMKIETGMEKKEADALRIGWDFLIDIDCEHGIKFSKLAARAIIETLKQHGIKNIGLKYSGSKGFHIIVPWKAFPKNLNGIETKNLFPELPRTLIAYAKNYSANVLKSILPEDFESEIKDELKTGYICKNCGEFAAEFRFVEFRCEHCDIFEIKKMRMGTKGKLPKCYKCKREMNFRPMKKFIECERCKLDSIKNPENFTTEEKDIYSLMGLDLILVSPRHLFRMPYSLHEKTSLVSAVIDEKDLEEFKFKDAEPLRIKIKNFLPDSDEDEAGEFVMQALDWAKSAGLDKEAEKRASGKYENFRPVKIKNLKDDDFPPTFKKILEGVADGKKRALFALINFFRGIGLEKEDLEKRIFEWNKKNETPLKIGYITGQLSWSYKRKSFMPPNFTTDYYKGIGVIPTSEELKLKNPVTYVIKKNSSGKK
jgi:DNA-directed RNA polymerase subunit RPC12/RpoP